MQNKSKQTSIKNPELDDGWLQIKSPISYVLQIKYEADVVLSILASVLEFCLLTEMAYVYLN